MIDRQGDTVEQSCKSAMRRVARLGVRLVRDDSAQDLLEYAFLAAFLGIAGWVVLGSLGPTILTTYNSWTNSSGVPSLWQPPEPSSGS